MGGHAGGDRVGLSSFVGREDDVEVVERRLEAARLVSLTGPGGVGKTRLALEVAGRARDRGAVVPVALLASATEPDLVVGAVAAASGVPAGTSAESTFDALVGHLHDCGEILLVLDNCEHLLTAVAALAADVIALAPRCRILATSRQALGVPGEAIHVVGPLALPRTEALAEVLASASGRLFADRASHQDSGFRLDGATSGTVAAIVRRLDGLPLAIELAAAQVRSLGLIDLLHRLDDQLEVLQTTPTTTDTRHAAIEATIAWSYGSLPERLRSLLAELSVFIGGFSLEAAEEICTPVPDGGSVYRRIADLVGASLLVRDDRLSSETRYRLLEPVRQFAARQLAGRPSQVVTNRNVVLRRDENGWIVGIEGAEARVRHEAGLQHVHRLLQTPGREVAALDLVGGVDVGGSSVETIDKQALLAYRRRLLDLDHELEAARRAGDERREATADEEREALLAELRRATGLGGRPRRVGAAGERARVAVTKAIRRSLQRLEGAAPDVAQHLQATIRTGTFCAYEPGPDEVVEWML